MMVRYWMRREGVELCVECEQKHQLFQRAQLDVVRRRQATRMLQFHNMFESYTTLLQHIFTNIDYWASELKLLEKKLRYCVNSRYNCCTWCVVNNDGNHVLHAPDRKNEDRATAEGKDDNKCKNKKKQTKK